MESSFHLKYLADGLKVAAIDPDDEDALDIGELIEYVDYLDVTYPVGTETTDVYSEIEGIHDGGNPFPVDIIVDQYGIIQYIGREYDALAMQGVVDELLYGP